MANNDPFAGLRLSEQTAPTKIEQRLFTAEPLQVVNASKEKEPPKAEAFKLASVPKLTPPKPTLTAAPKPHQTSVSRFDLSDEPLYKASYVFTLEELEALEDLKLELRREYDTKVTKNNLIRSALHMLLEDHKANGVRSYASRKIRKG